MSGRILIVCGLRREAALAGPDVAAAISGGRRERLDAELEGVEPRGLSAVISFGLAGGLDPMRAAGDILVPAAVISARGPSSANPALVRALEDALRAAGLAATTDGAIAGVDDPVANADAKAQLRARTGAIAVDMESHVAAAYADRFRLPFAALRVVSDPSNRNVPPAAVAAMGEGGAIDVRAALLSLVRQPGQIPALIGVARDGALAFRRLRRVGGLLRGSLGLHLR